MNMEETKLEWTPRCCIRIEGVSLNSQFSIYWNIDARVCVCASTCSLILPIDRPVVSNTPAAISRPSLAPKFHFPLKGTRAPWIKDWFHRWEGSICCQKARKHLKNAVDMSKGHRSQPGWDPTGPNCPQGQSEHECQQFKNQIINHWIKQKNTNNWNRHW